ncbi:NCS1 family nucleobase:cation symporter-1 [Pseudonocardia eucalypti]|uniref:NCS1 family nucleobase:cation symporter-1 n=1 Tax=Pseudonocardia eucalypti TaxID=648755 RepID=A0ABP9PX51_9PSEU|nr:NCS1 family nucleobase:cation symporter-1 [Pseudonocardia eucalypti]
MTTTPERSSQTTDAEGRVDLVDRSSVTGSPYANEELLPTPLAERKWTTYNYFALWMGMAHNIPSYLLASGLIALGMDWLQGFITITLANVIVLVPMLLNSHAGTKYGIPFPVFARAYYGLRGANLAALLRAFIACGWFGIQTWVGGQAIFVIMGKLAGDPWLRAGEYGGHPWTMWLSFAVFWAFQMLLIWRGIEALRRFENWAAPLVSVAFLGLMAWIVMQVGGLGPIFTQPSKLGWGAEFWAVFAPSLMGMIAFWATLSLNMPDFTRFGGSQRKQLLGQIYGLPTTMAFISMISIVVTSGTIVLYGEAIWDPVEVASRFESPVAVVIGLVMAVLATMSCNVAANVVSPSYDFSNALPRWLNFRTAGLTTGVIGVVIQPWRLVSDPHTYIFTWLGFYGGVLASVAGVLIAGYWLVGRTQIDLADLYRPEGRYWFNAGWNWQAVVATLLGALVAVGGAYSKPGEGPFPADGLIPLFQPFYDYSWLTGLVVGAVVYLALVRRGVRAAR